MRDIILISILIIVLVLIFWPDSPSDTEGFTTTPSNKESIDNVLSVYNKDKMSVTNMNVTGDLAVTNKASTADLAVTNNLDVTNKTSTKDLVYTGDITGPTTLAANGSITMKPSGTITAPGRLHISGDELLYLLNKSGVIVGTAWGGNGNLTVQGAIMGPTIDAINNGKVSRGHRIFNNREYGGWDLGDFGGTSDIVNCADRCRPYRALAAVRRKSDGHCWCKSLAQAGGNNNDWDLALIDFGN